MNKFIIILIVLLIVGFGAWYLFFQKNGGEELPSPDGISATEQVSASDQVSTLDQEVNATDIANLDKELSGVETELEAALQE